MILSIMCNVQQRISCYAKLHQMINVQSDFLSSNIITGGGLVRFWSSGYHFLITKDITLWVCITWLPTAKLELTCNHFDIYTKIQSPPYSLSTVMPWRIKKGQEANELPRATQTFFPSFWNFLHNMMSVPIKDWTAKKNKNQN